MFEKMKAIEKAGLERKTVAVGCSSTVNFEKRAGLVTVDNIPLPSSLKSTIPDDVLNARVNGRIVFLFAVVVSGILASWLWKIGWAYLKDPSEGLLIGSVLSIIVRFALSIIAAILIFKPTYEKINQSSSESWIPPFVAFQNGFLCQDLLDTIIK